MHIARETAGAARTRSSLRPLYLHGGIEMQNFGQIMPRDRETVSSVIASEAKQSIVPQQERMDCFAEPVIGRRFAPTRWLAMTWRERASLTLVITRLVRNCALGRVIQYSRGVSD
jgi:hypothetical protein